MRKTLGTILILVTLLVSTASAGPSSPIKDDLEVWNIMEYELGVILCTQPNFPRMTVFVRDWSRYKGWTLTPNGAYPVFLWDQYESYYEAHFVIAHEFGHVWLKHNGMPDTEANADLFAYCFGSLTARKFRTVSGDCAIFQD